MKRNNKEQKEILEQKEFLRQVIDASPSLVFVKDINGKYILANKAMAKLYGTTITEMEGKTDHDFAKKNIINVKEADKYVDADREVIENRKEKYISEETVTSFDEKITYFQTNKIPIILNDGSVCCLGVSSDITARKKSEEELLKVNAELEQFAYVASHDLQEPLRAVYSYCQLLKEKEYDNVNDEGKKYFNYIIDSSLRMRNLIKELLDYSRVGRKDKPFEKINLGEVLEEVLNDFEVLIKETEANIIIDRDIPHIFGIRFRIKQLLHNIISNSLKFKSEEKPVIRIICCNYKKNSHYWLFYIKDNGLGIEPKYYDRIFGIFKRLYSREEYPGTGIGLALCKRIVEAHGGKIWVKSQKDKGTCIYFTIAKSWGIFDN